MQCALVQRTSWWMGNACPSAPRAPHVTRLLAAVSLDFELETQEAAGACSINPGLRAAFCIKQLCVSPEHVAFAALARHAVCSDAAQEIVNNECGERRARA